MELRQLEYFLMVSKVHSFTRAAERLYVSQPAVTNAVRSLEDELGILLFDRSQKQALLTAEGQVFFNHVENVMHGVSKTISEINQLKNLSSGILTLGITPLAGISPSVDFIKRFQALYPHIHLAISEDHVAGLQRALVEDKIDLAMIIDGEPNNFLETIPIAREELVVCCSRRHKFAALPSISLAALVNEEFLLFPKTCLLRKKIIAAFERANTLPRIRLELNHVQTTKTFVAQEAGISLLPRSLAEGDRHLTALSLDASLEITLCIARKKNKCMSHAAQAFLDLAEKARIS